MRTADYVFEAYKEQRRYFPPEIADILDDYVKLASDKHNPIWITVEGSEIWSFRVNTDNNSMLYQTFFSSIDAVRDAARDIIDRPMDIWFLLFNLNLTPDGGRPVAEDVSVWCTKCHTELRFGPGGEYRAEHFDNKMLELLKDGLNRLLTIKAIYYDIDKDEADIFTDYEVVQPIPV